MRRRSTKVSPGEKNDTNRPTKDEINATTNTSLSPKFMDHSDIKKRAIQVLYTEGHDRRTDFLSFQTIQKFPYFQVLHPNGLFRSSFDVVTVIWVLLLVYMIPFQVGFDWYELSQAEKIIMNLLDVWFAFDIILNFRTGYIHHGTIIMDPRKIVKNYLSTWFLIDFLGTFPFERFVQGESVSSRKSLKLIKYFKIPKLLRISRLLKYVRDHKSVYDIFQVLVLVITFLHVGACLWMLIISPCDEIDEVNLQENDLCSQGNVDRLYIESFHLSAAMMLGVSNSHIVGKSSTLDMLTERREQDQGLMYAASTIFMISGLFLAALLLSELNVFIFGKMQGSAAFQRKIDRVTHEMEYYAVPDDLQLQVKAFYDYIWIHQKQYDDRIALLSDDQMSTDLQRKLALHLFKDVVSHISIFSEIDDLLLGEICLSLRTRIFLPQDMILFKGDVGKELFIISKGVVEVLRDDLPFKQRKHTPPIFLKKGSFFGEIALIMETRRTCSVQARTVCEVNILQQRTFDTILRQNPDFARRMNELVVARQLERSLSKTANDGADVKVSKDDLDAAISIVERNMKQGLDRRMRRESISFSTIDVTQPYDSLADETEEGEFQSKTSNLTRQGDTERSSKSQIRKVAHRIRSSLKQSPSCRRVDEVTRVIDDIARRSTKFSNTDPPRQRSESLPFASKPGVDSSSQRDRSYSDSDDRGNGSTMNYDNKTANDPLSKAIEENSMKNEINEATHPFSIVDGEGEDTETMIVTGHYNPNRVKVDISKVLPSILNSGDQCNSFSQIEKQLAAQGQLIQKLISTVEILNTEKEDVRAEDRGR